MKTKNLLSTFILLAIALFTTFSVSSCSDDDDDKQENNTGIVGKWKCDYGYDCYDIFTFNSNGTGIYEDFFNGDYDREEFRYVFDSKKNRITLIDEDGDSETADIEVTPNYLIIDGDIYYKQSDDNPNNRENTEVVENYSSKNFVGRWKCEEYEDDGYWINILTFKSDGTGLFEEYDKWENEVAKFRYTIDSKNDKLLLYYDDGEYERWEIDLVTSKYLILDGDRYDRQ